MLIMLADVINSLFSQWCFDLCQQGTNHLVFQKASDSGVFYIVAFDLIEALGYKLRMMGVPTEEGNKGLV
jgi:hypothetical protein